MLGAGKHSTRTGLAESSPVADKPDVYALAAGKCENVVACSSIENLVIDCDIRHGSLLRKSPEYFLGPVVSALDGAQLVSVLVDLDEGVDDVIHIFFGANQGAGSPDHGHFLTNPVTVGTMILLAILLQTLLGKHLLIHLRTQHVIYPG